MTLVNEPASNQPFVSSKRDPVELAGASLEDASQQRASCDGHRRQERHEDEAEGCAGGEMDRLSHRSTGGIHSSNVRLPCFRIMTVV